MRSSPPDRPNLRREVPLRQAEERRERRREEGLWADGLGRADVRRQDGKGTPGECEPEVGVEAAAEELEVVRHDDERPEGNEWEQQRRPREGCGETDGGGAPDRPGCEHNENPIRDRGPQRASVELVESMRPDAEREEERRETPEQSLEREGGCECCADDDI